MKNYLNFLMFACLIFNCVCKLKKLRVPEYDSFIFAIQWAKCQRKLKQIPENTISIHGLWPALSNGERLPECNTPDREIMVVPNQLSNYNKLKSVWPSLTSDDDSSFWTYEYNKHGYCYNLKNNLKNYSDYFKKVLEVFYLNDYPNLFKRAFPNQKGEISLTHDELVQKINEVFPGQYYKFLCKKVNEKQYVTEMYISLGLDFKSKSTKTTLSCPTTKPLYLYFK